MRDLGPFTFIEKHAHRIEDDDGPGPGYTSDTARSVFAAPAGFRSEPYSFEAKILDAPDALVDVEGRAVVQGALNYGIKLSYDHRRGGFTWDHVLERLEHYGLDAAAPSVGLPAKRPRIIDGVRART